MLISTSAALGLSLLRWRPEHILLGLLLISYLLPHIFILSEDRFHLALVPYFAMLAAQVWVGGFREIFLRWRQSQIGKTAVILAICAVALLLMNWEFELFHDAAKIVQLLGPNGNQSYFPY